MSGLMEPMPQPDNILSTLKRQLGPTSAEPLSLDQRLSILSERDLGLVQTIAPLVKMIGQMERGQVTYQQAINKSYPGISAELRQLIADLLQEADPLPEPKVSSRTELNRDAVTASIQAQYQSALDSAFNENLIRGAKAARAEQQAQGANDQFLANLTQSESSGNSQAEITIKDGRRFVGSLQFGQDRLKDYQAATGKSFTQDEFKADEALQDDVAQWHIADLDEAIDALGDAAKGYDRDGLRSVAHLGGKGGMRKFVRSNGDYNPADELGTSLKDYYDKFSGKT